MQRQAELGELLHQPAVTAPIIGPRTAGQLDGALAALEITLDDRALGSPRLASMSIFTSFTRPPAARTTFSSVGVSCLHGPHQVAQKSTTTGTVREASMTSRMKVFWSPSTIIPAGVPAGIPAGIPAGVPAGRLAVPAAAAPGAAGFWPMITFMGSSFLAMALQA